MRLLQVAVVVPTLRDRWCSWVLSRSATHRCGSALASTSTRRALDLLAPLGQCDHARPRLVVVTTATQCRTDTTHATLIALTVNELRRLFDAPVLHALDTGGPCWHGRDGCDHAWAV